MPNCKVCGKSVSCGFVICSDSCYGKLKVEPDDIRHKELSFITYFEDESKRPRLFLMSNDCEKDALSRLFILQEDIGEIDCVYFIETKKLVPLKVGGR